MKLNHFKIKKTFWMSGKKYMCTDVGTRVVSAICVDEGDGYIEIETNYPDGRVENYRADAKKEGWTSGPIYALAEIVIDENSQEVCTVRKPKPA